MNTDTPAPAALEAADANPLSDEYVNAVIQRHGYDSPESVIAQLQQWVGLHGGEDSVTLLMYEAHKALIKLRAPVADERAAFEAWNSKHGQYRRSDAYERDDNGHYLEWPVENGWRVWQARAALGTAPVAVEAVYKLRVRGAIQAWTPTSAAFSIPDGEHQLFLSPSSPPAGKAVRILFPTHLRKMWSGGEVQSWLDEHQGVTAQTPSAKGSLERYRAWQAEQAAAPCSCPSGDGSLRWSCPAKHPLSK
ncbi:hypothetical protein LMG26686_02813 [Achromobacter mucicolens]|uniref:hypothetical protein n=1 Tax=Achromobacter mucicolens TaxID=1389922 RepID=UPI001467197F|nr:hypothetical protein [Achromobacter mucicolens]CAB3868061.1 hypothetical protein LMG26686_02813 [Achromobacter mucicolens]